MRSYIRCTACFRKAHHNSGTTPLALPTRSPTSCRRESVPIIQAIVFRQWGVPGRLAAGSHRPSHVQAPGLLGRHTSMSLARRNSSNVQGRSAGSLCCPRNRPSTYNSWKAWAQTAFFSQVTRRYISWLVAVALWVWNLHEPQPCRRRRSSLVGIRGTRPASSGSARTGPLLAARRCRVVARVSHGPPSSPSCLPRPPRVGCPNK